MVSNLISGVLTTQEVLGAPECMSFVFNEDGKVSSFTGGYIMDRWNCSPMSTFLLKCFAFHVEPFHLACCLLLRLALSCGVLW